MTRTPHPAEIPWEAEIGRASCRERGEISGGAGSLKKKKSGIVIGRFNSGKEIIIKLSIADTFHLLLVPRMILCGRIRHQTIDKMERLVMCDVRASCLG